MGCLLTHFENASEERHQSPSSLRLDVLCAAHGEKLLLFCLDDKHPACLVCRNSEKHAGHELRPIDEAVRHLKEELAESRKPLIKKLGFFDEVRANDDLTQKHIEFQAQHTERQIKEQFKKLRQYLQDQEEFRIAALWEEDAKAIEEEQRKRMATIQATEDQLRLDDISFLRNYAVTMARVQRSLSDPQLLSEAQVDVAKHLGNLTFRIWHKMKDFVSYTPVILDPNTAYPELVLSDDLTGVRRGEKQRLPDNPERFNDFVNFHVLAREGFNSGTHSWDVEVGGNRCWVLGMLSESCQRDRYIGGRYWEIGFCSGAYKVVSSPGSQRELSLDHKPSRIRVQLDWSGGKLSFSDPDSDTELHTFTHTFTETLFPYICNGDDDELLPLTVLPGKICVTVESCSYTPRE